MTTQIASTFEVSLEDPLNASHILEETLPEPGKGEIILEVEKFALTSNNLTYALLGNDTPTRYWDVFPAEDGWGRVPAWGSARVIAGDETLARTGERFVGLLPMADRFVFAGHRAEDGSLASSAPKRSAMPAMYSAMRRVDEEDARQDAAESANFLLQAFYSFAAFLARDVSDGRVKTAVVSSASSKAGLLVGKLLTEAGIRTIGLTSPSRASAIESTGAFADIVSYPEIAELTMSDETAFLDIAGNPELTKSVTEALGENLERLIVVGASHAASAGAPDGDDESADDEPTHDEPTHDEPTDEGPEVEMFDTAEQEVAFVEEQGAAALIALEDAARDVLLPWASGWVHVDEVAGIANLEEAWKKVQEPPASPLHGTVIVATSR